MEIINAIILACQVGNSKTPSNYIIKNQRECQSALIKCVFNKSSNKVDSLIKCLEDKDVR